MSAAVESERYAYVLHLPVLGVLITFASNSERVIDIIRTFYGAWADPVRTGGIVSASSAIVRIRVQPDRSPSGSSTSPLGNAFPFAVRYNLTGPTILSIDAPGGQGVADSTRLESRAVVSPDMVARSTDLVEGFVEPLTLFLLGALDREPLHAAGIVRDGVAILLAGSSGQGKSTIAYAACQRGYTLLADEPVYIQTVPVLRVWGRRARIHLRADACSHFPELSNIAPTLLPTGKTKIVVELPDATRYADRVGVCVLGRASNGKPNLERLSTAQVVAQLSTALEPGYHLFANTIGNRLSRISAGGAWCLQVGRNPHDALPLLDAVMVELTNNA